MGRRRQLGLGLSGAGGKGNARASSSGLCGVSGLFFSAMLVSAPACAGNWIGPAGGDLLNAANWSDGITPDVASSTVYVTMNNGSGIGIINPLSVYQLHFDEIGVGAGANATASLQFSSAYPGSVNTFQINSFFDNGDGSGRSNPLIVGGNGGSGIVNITLDADAQVIFQNNLIVGSGAGGNGLVNVFGAGKAAAHAPICTDYQCQGSSISYTGEGSSLLPTVIGYDGGHGQLTANGAGIGPQSGYTILNTLQIGVGGGSVGELNILNRGKISSTGPTSFVYGSNPTVWTPVIPFTIGLDGGNGTLNIDASNALFNNGLAVGIGAGSVGQVNLLGGGKAQSFISVDPNGFPGPPTRQEVAEQLSTKLGIDGGSGGIAVTGAGAIWYVSGNYGYISTSTNATSDAGDLYVGYSGQGTLTIADDGRVRIGTGTITSTYGPIGYLSGDGEMSRLDEAAFVSNGVLHLGYQAGGFGTVNIGAPVGQAPVAPGILETGRIEFGPGSGAVHFNHTSQDFVFDTTISDGIYGAGVLDAVAGRTILSKDQPNFIGILQASTGTLQINSDISTASARVLAGGTLEGNGIVGDTTSSGIIAPGATPSLTQGRLDSIGTLTIAGNYASSGGSLAIDAVLGTDNSPADLLIIQGNVSGTSLVRVTNVGGLGAQTLSDGIKVIQINGASPGGAFILAGDFVTSNGAQAIIAGAYAYTLNHNGIANPSDGNWYLRSDLANSGGGGGGGSGGGNNPRPDVLPLYQPLVPIAEVYPQALLSFLDMGTYRQRTGERGDGQLSARANDNRAQNGFFWAQVKTTHGYTEPDNSRTGATASSNVWLLRSGLEGAIYQNGDQVLLAGLNVLAGQSTTHVKSIYRNGDIDVTAYGVGASLTWQGNNGFYLDGQARSVWFDSDLKSDAVGRLVKGNKGFGYAASLEGGQKFSLGNGWSAIPQAQLAYGNVNFDSFKDRFGTVTSLNNGDQLIGRVGVSIDYDRIWSDNPSDIRLLNVYGIANLYRNFIDKTQVDIAKVPFERGQAAWWGGLGLGARYNWSSGRYSVFGEADVKTNLGNFGRGYALGGHLGLKVKW